MTAAIIVVRCADCDEPDDNVDVTMCKHGLVHFVPPMPPYDVQTVPAHCAVCCAQLDGWWEAHRDGWYADRQREAALRGREAG